jgi:hypothetical protein
MSNSPVLDRPSSTDPGHRSPHVRRRTWLVVATVSVVILVALGAALATGVFSGDEEANGDPTPGTAMPIADGEHFGSVSAFTLDELRFDPAELFHGQAATDAARADGELADGEELPNPFYIRDGDEPELTLPIADGFEATLIDGATLQPTSPLAPAELAALFQEGVSRDAYYGFAAEALPVVVTIDGGAVVSLVQQYLP